MQGHNGYLLASTLGAMLERDALLCPQPLRDGGPTLTFVGEGKLANWDELELISQISLAEENEAISPGPYRYRVLAIRGFSKLILLAERKRVVDYVLSQIFDRQVAPRLRKVSLNLDETIRFCEQATSPYLVTSLHGRVAGPSRQLRAIALYGDDITDTALFREFGHLFNVYSCGLGRRLRAGLPTTMDEEGEIVRVGNDGFVLAHLGSRTKEREFMKVISFIVEHRWVESWVPVAVADAREGGDLG